MNDDPILTIISWTPPNMLTFGTFSGPPDRYKIVLNGRESFVAQNEAGDVRSTELNLDRGLKCHLEVIPEYRGENFFEGPKYFGGKACGIDFTTPA